MQLASFSLRFRRQLASSSTVEHRRGLGLVFVLHASVGDEDKSVAMARVSQADQPPFRDRLHLLLLAFIIVRCGRPGNPKLEREMLGHSTNQEVSRFM